MKLPKLTSLSLSQNLLRFFALIFVINLAFFNPASAVAAGVPSIMSYQGRLTDASGNLLGGSGTSYYFKFSLWNNATVGSGTKLWPTGNPTAVTSIVRTGVFNVNIGDTANGYPDVLDYTFNSSSVFLQVEVSTNGVSYETLSPRQQVSSSAFSQVSGAVSGTGQSSFGTVTPHSNSVVSIEATSSTAKPLSIKGASSQEADLFSINDVLSNPLFIVNNTGGVFASSTLGVTGLTTLHGGLLTLGSTTLQNFTAGNSTTTAATTTNLFATTGNVTNLSSDSLTANSLTINTLSGCLVATNGLVSSTGLPCGAGGGGGSSGGSWSTTTSQVSGQFINYPNNPTDVVAIGSFATTSAPFWFDPNAQIANLSGLTNLTNLIATGSTTLQNFTGRNATTTNATTTTFFATTASSTNFFARNANIGTLVTGGISIGTLNGLLQGVNGSVSTIATSTLGIALPDTTGTLAVNRGGTGLTSFTQGDVIYASGSGTLAGTSTANLKASLALNNVENTALSTWAGSSALTTLGTVTSGTWHGIAIEDAYITKSGDWTGLFDGQDGSYYLANGFSTTSAIYFANSSTTIAKTYSANVFTGLNTFNGGLTASSLSVGSLTGPLQAINGVVSATSTISVVFGGTGSTTLSGILKGNGVNGVATAVAGTDYVTPNVTTLTGLTTIGTLGSLNVSGLATLGNILATGSTTLQNFTGLNATTTNATTTTQFATVASSTNLYTTTLTAGLINGQQIGSVSNFTGTVNVAGLTTLGNILATGSSTLQNFTGLNATTTNATTTTLAITNIPSALLKTNASGSVIPAILNTDYINSSVTTLSSLTSIGTLTSLNVSGLATLGNILATGSTTLQNFTGGNATTTNATTTNLAITNVSNALLKTLPSGAVVAAVLNTDYLNSSVTTLSSLTSIGTLGSLNVSGLATLGNILATGSSTLQNFTGLNATTTNATTTTLAITNISSALLKTGANGNVIPAILNTDYLNSSVTTLSSLTSIGTLTSLNVSGLSTLGTILATGSTTLQNFTGLNATTTNATSTTLAITNVSNALLKTLPSGAVVAAVLNTDYLNSSVTTLSSLTSIGTLTSLNVSGLATLGNILATGSTTLQNFTGLNATTTNATTTTQFATVASSTNLYTTTLTAGLINGQQVGSVSNFTGTLTVGGLTTFTNGFLSMASSTLQNFTGLNATTTNATSTSFFAANASSTNLFATVASLGLINGQNIGSATSFTGTLAVTGLSTFATALHTGSTTLQNFTGGNATTTNATTTNLAITNVSNALLKTLPSGAVVAAVLNTDYLNSSVTTLSSLTSIGTLGSLNVSGLATLGNILATGSSTLQNFTGVNATTTNATSTSLAVLNLGTANCDVKADGNGSLYCGLDMTSSGGSGGGTWATTTSNVAGQLINYSVNTTDIVIIGGISTTAARYWFDPNAQIANLSGLTNVANFLANGSTTLQNFTGVNATTTNATTTSLFATNASSTNLYTTTLTAGLINGQQVGSVSNFTGTVNVAGLTTLGNILATGSSTLQNFTGLNATTTNATTTTLAITSIGSSLLKTNAGGSVIPAILNTDYINSSVTTLSSLTSIGTLTSLNVSGLATLGNILATGSSTLQNFTALNATTTNATTTTQFASVASSTNLFATAATLGLINGQQIGSVSSLTGTLTVGGLTTFTNGFLSMASSTLQNFTGLNATTTNATSTSLFATNASSTNLFATVATLGLINGQNISTGANFTGTLSVTGLSTFTNGFLSMASSTLQNFTGGNSTTTNATSTSLFARVFQATTGIIAGTATTTNLVATSTFRIVGGTSFPTSVAEGTMFYRTDLGAMYTYASSTWKTDKSVATFVVAASNTKNKEKADYQADGTNDEVEINNAIQSVPSTGGIVYLLEGTYTIGESVFTDIGIKMKSNVKLVGAGPSTIIKLKNSNNSDIAMISMSGVDQAVVSDLMIDGNKANQSSGTIYGVQVTGSTVQTASSTLESLVVANLRTDGIIISYGKNISIKNNIVRANTGYGINVPDGAYSIITGNHAVSNGSYGIALSGGGQSIVTDNQVTFNNAGIAISGGENLTSILNNNISHNVSHGIFSSGYEGLITNNKIYDNGGDGITGSFGSGAINGNYIQNNLGAGINLSDSGGNTFELSIAGNNITGNASYGIGIDAGAAVISGNFLKDNGGTSTSTIYIAAAGYSNTIVGNTIWANNSTRYAIEIAPGSDGNYIATNDIYGGLGGTQPISDLGTNTRYTSNDRLTLDTVTSVAYSLMNTNASSSVALANFTQQGTGKVAAFGNASTEFFTIANNGNVGIGSTTPAATLGVRGNIFANNFTGTNFFSTSTSASVFPYASTTAISASTICLAGDCRTSWPSASGGAFAWTPTTNYGINVNATTSALWFQNQIFASSSATFASIVTANNFIATGTIASIFPYASTTALTATTLFSTTANTNTLLALGSTTLQNFTALNATTTNATTTTQFASVASSTNLFATAATLGLINGQQIGSVSSLTGTLTVGGLTTFTNGFLSMASSTLQNFTGLNATTTNATSTSLFATNASSTNLFATVATLGLINGQNISTGANFTGTLSVTGLSTFTTALHTGSTTLQNFTALNATTTNATSTNSLYSPLLTATTICITGDSCRTSWPSAGSGAFPFITTTNFNQTANSTTTALWLRGSPIALSASSTSIFDYASTTAFTSFGNAYLAKNGGNVGIGATSTPYARLSVVGSSTINQLFSVSQTSGTNTLAPFLYTNATGTTYFDGAVVKPLNLGSIVHGSGGALLDGARSVFVSGNYAYVASFDGSSFEIIDISNPMAPVHKGSLANGAGGALLAQADQVYVAGNYAYVTSQGSSALEIIDVSNPAAPVHKGSIVDGAGGASISQPRGVFVSGNYAYIASYSGNVLEIVDVSNPAAPVHKGSLANGVGGAVISSPWSVYVSGNYAYVTSYFGDALEIVDVSNPAAPMHKGKLLHGSGGAALDGATSVFVSGKYAYVASYDGNNLEIVDVSNPSSPVHKGSLLDGVGGASIANPLSVFVSGNYAYLADNTVTNLEIVDVSNPAAPVHKGTNTTLLNAPGSIFVSGNYAYLASSFSDSLEIVDIGGTVASNSQIGTAKIDNLQIMATALFNQNINGQGGLSIASNALFGGALTVSNNATSSTNNPVSAIFLNGNVGVGTTSPYARLSVWGAGTGNGKAFEIGNNASTSIFSVTDIGKTTFLYGSSTAISAGTICLTSDTCRTTWPSASGGAFPYVSTTNYNLTVNSTTSPMWFRNQIFASSSAVFAGDVRASTFNSTSTTATSTIAGKFKAGHGYFGNLAYDNGSDETPLLVKHQSLDSSVYGVGISLTNIYAPDAINPSLNSSAGIDIWNISGISDDDSVSTSNIERNQGVSILTTVFATTSKTVNLDYNTGMTVYSPTKIGSGTSNILRSFGIDIQDVGTIVAGDSAAIRIANNNAIKAESTVTNTNYELIKLDTSNNVVLSGSSRPVIDYGNFTIVNATDPTFLVQDTTNTVNTVIQSTDTYGLIGTLSNHPLFLATNSGLTMTLLANGAVGVGTTSPFASFAVNPTAGQASNQFVVGSSTATNFIVTNSGNVGIGSTSPSARFVSGGSSYLGTSTASILTFHAGTVIYPTAATTTLPFVQSALTFATSTTALNPVMSLSFSSTGATSTIGYFVSTTTLLEAGGNANRQPSVLKNYIIIGNGKLQAGMGIMNGGLCVDSDGWCSATTTGRVSSRTTSTNGSDLAEVYTTDEQLESGDIVSSLTGIKVRKTSESTMGSVMGIISTAPGVILGLGPDESEDTPGNAPIALTGRVPVKVNLEGGPIAVGDFITVSSVPGIGMKANPASSTRVVAMALEAFNSNTPGKILSFIDRTTTSGDSSKLAALELKNTASLETISNLSNGLTALQVNLASTTKQLATRMDALEEVMKKVSIASTTLSLSEGLSVKGGAIFSGGLIVDSIGSATTTISMLSDLTFIGRPYFTNDTGGSAVIKKGARQVEIVFDKEYMDTPIVNATIALESASTTDMLEETIFANDIRHIVTKKNVRGFTILLNKVAPVDIGFSWTALAVKNGKMFTSKDGIVEVLPIPQAPVPTAPTPIIPTTTTNSTETTTTPATATTTPEVATTTPAVVEPAPLPVPETAATTSEASVSTTTPETP